LAKAIQPVVRRLANGVGAAAAGARELLARPLDLWLRAAEAAGNLLLEAWETGALPLLDLAAAAVRGAVRTAERIVTPARALGVVALVAAVAVAGAQFADYRAVELGAPSYRGLEDVASAPRRDVETLRAAHGVAMLALAAAALLVTALAMRRNRRLARLLVVIGAAGVAVSLLVDVPHGLREGQLAISYEGAQAVLLGAFWAQLSAAVTLVVVGPLLAAQPQGAGVPGTSRGGARRRRAPAVDAVRASAGVGATESRT
jgi:hypothetical protein